SNTFRLDDGNKVFELFQGEMGHVIPYFFIIKEAGWLALNDEHLGLQPSAVKKINNPTAIRFLQKINRCLAKKLRAPEDSTSASIS
ncbi:hypothetical protein, partial [Klebsiella oxytoca]|uniref:hypothetical protein n=1 Tax=Klebsiella oxytoca TaxID=571 RepID=UPI0013D88C7F